MLRQKSEKNKSNVGCKKMQKKMILMLELEK